MIRSQAQSENQRCLVVDKYKNRIPHDHLLSKVQANS